MITNKPCDIDIKIPQHSKNPTNKIDNIIEKGKNLIEKLNNNIVYAQPNSLYLNPFSKVGVIDDDEYNNLDTLDKIGLLEYSGADFNSDDKQAFKKDSISESDQMSFLNDININIKEYDNFILKIEDLKIQDSNILSSLNQNLVYVECRVPLFHVEKCQDVDQGRNLNPIDNLYYDTFKIFNKSEREDNIYHLSHVSYHKLKLGENNFGCLANSKIEIYLHKIESQTNQNIPNNSGSIIGKGTIDFNRIFLSKDFFFTANLEILYFQNTFQKELGNEESKNVSNEMKSINQVCKKRTQYEVNQKSKQNNNSTKIIKNTQNIKDTKDKNHFKPSVKGKFIDFPYKIAELEISCQLFKNSFNNDKDLKSNYRLFEKFKSELGHESNEEEKNINGNNMREMRINPENLIKNSEHNLMQQGMNYQEVKVDYDGILVLYLKITDLKPLIFDKSIDPENYQRNYYISHKVFPNREVSSSDIMWNSIKPDFNYQMLMPFALNSKVIDLIENGYLLIEVWDKGNVNDELLGIARLELSPILDSLKIAEDLISITPISKSLLPLILYDGYEPVYNYEHMGNICYLQVILGLGTTTQINNFIQKHQKVINHKVNNEKMMKNKIDKISENKHDFDIHNRSDINDNKIASRENSKQIMDKNYHEEEINEINNLLNKCENNYNYNHQSNLNYSNSQGGIPNNQNADDDVDVEEMLEKNRKELEQININKLKNTGTSLISNSNDTKKYEGNPFLITRDKEKEENFKKKEFTISKESNFYLYEKEKDKDKELTKFTYNEFYNSKKDKRDDSNIPDFNSLYLANEEDIVTNHAKSIKSPTFNDGSKIIFRNTNGTSAAENFKSEEAKKIEKPESEIKQVNEKTSETPIINKQLKKDYKKENYNYAKESIGYSSETEEKIMNKKSDSQDSFKKSHLIKHSFEILISKIYNLQVLSKVRSPYLRYKFLSDTEPIRSDTLNYTSYDKETSIIDVDMKTSHSVVLNFIDSIKDHVQDFTIELVSLSTIPDTNEEITFGRINIPSEELLNLISSNSSKNSEGGYLETEGKASKNKNKYQTTIFIYGTEKIKREECIIGKMKIEIEYSHEKLDDTLENSGSIIKETQTVFNRKIPKNATLVIKLNYFKYDKNFLNYFDLNHQTYFFVFDPFGESKNLKKVFKSKNSSVKKKSLNGIFEEDFHFDMVIEKEILEYFKNKNFLLTLMVSERSQGFENFSSDSENENQEHFEKIGTGKINLSDIISNPDYSSKNYKIISNKDLHSTLGYVNLELKLENSNFIASPITNKRKKSNVNLDNLNTILQQKNTKRLDGKFFFVLNYHEVLFDEGFINKLQKYDNKNTNIFFMFKFGKSLKKISQLFNLKENINQLFTNPKIYNRNLNFYEILELNLCLSKNKPEDLIKQLIESILEIKIFIKTEEENENIGSFLIDLSKVFESNYKINENIYFSDLAYSYCYNFEKNREESLKLSFSFALIKSDLSSREFSGFYKDMKTNSKEILKKLNDSNLICEELRGMLKNYNEGSFKEYYSYIDLNLISLEDYHGNVKLENIKNMCKIFSPEDNNRYDEILYGNEIIHEIFSNKILNLKSTSDAGVSQYSLTKEKLVEVLKYKNNDLNLINELDSLVDYYLCKISEWNDRSYFAVYAMKNLKESYHIDLFDCIFELKNLIYSPKENINLYDPIQRFDAFYKSIVNKDNRMNTFKLFNKRDNITTVTIILTSANNLTKSRESSRHKPNCYFTFSWREDYFVSDVVENTDHPSWNKQLEIKIPADLNLIHDKLKSGIIFKFFSKNSLPQQTCNPKSYNQIQTNFENYLKDSEEEYLGEVIFNMDELIKYNFFNYKNEYEGYFNIITNAKEIRGQVNIKFILDKTLLNIYGHHKKTNSMANLNEFEVYNNFNKSNKEFESCHNHRNSFTNFYTNNLINQEIANADYKDLWDKLHDNTETIKKLTNEIDMIRSNPRKQSGPEKAEINKIFEKDCNFVSTLERERRISEKYEKIIDENMVIDFEDEKFKRHIEGLTNDEDNQQTKNKLLDSNDANANINNNYPNLADNNLSHSRSIIVDVDILEKVYSYSAIQNDDDNKDIIQPDIKNNQNQSMFESFKKKEKPRRPPIPALNNLYKTADKNFLNKIQKILKNKDTKRLNYASSEEGSN